MRIASARSTAVILALAVFLASSSASADGALVDFPNAISLSDVVFHGRLVGKVKLLGYEVMLFSADRAWKGNVSRHQVVLTAKEHFYFEADTSYLVCASTSEFPWLPYSGGWESVRNATESDLKTLGPGTVPGIGRLIPSCIATALAIVAGMIWWVRRRRAHGRPPPSLAASP